MEKSRGGRQLRAHAGRIVGTIVVFCVASAGLIFVAQSAQAYDGSSFDPGMIIDDSLFFDDDALTEAEVQTFLEQKIAQVGGCAPSSYNCLANMRLSTPSEPAFYHSNGTLLCKPYQGADLEPVSRIIYKVQVACGISAKVLLVTLQKEQGLIFNDDPSDSRVNRAMGYMCPDSAHGGCGAAGFYQQLSGAAWQFEVYRAAPTRFNYRAGTSSWIQYKPESSCGSAWVRVQNAATAALYNYTPYVPNSAALANLGTYGDDCSSYGNRNFWDYYHAWFGSPTAIVPSGVSFDRLGGADRIDVAIGISQKYYDPTTDVVYVANALDFPDALSAAPAAALAGAPLLLVEPNTLRAQVKAEITRLTPSSIVVVGGAGSVSGEVFDELATIAPTARRDGTDRYASARSTVAASFSGGASTVYIATGEGFADALSAASVAASQGFPVLIVPGSYSAADSSTLQLLTTLGTVHVVIVGGPASVTPAFEDSLRSAGLSVSRFSGSSRYDVSSAINRSSYSSASTVYFASGENFPDALAGAALAGKNHAPLYLVQPGCVPRPMIEGITSFGTTNVVIFGGPASVGAGVTSWKNC